MSGTQRGKLSFLELVFPPLSNQEAFDFKDQPAANFMRQSDFYMIGGKPKSRFHNISISEDNSTITFNLYIGDDLKSSGSIDIYSLEAVRNSSVNDCFVGVNENSIEFFYKKEGYKYFIERFTPENILWHRSRKADGIIGLDNYEELLCYDLLYVGIAKKGDSYDRLIKNGHHARLDILSNEPQRYPGARVTDEIFLFLFRIEPE